MATHLHAETEDEYLNYTIPSDAIKNGPGPARNPHIKGYGYYPAGADLLRDHPIASELYKDGQLIRQHLYKNGASHGIQREWHENGTLKSEAPYKNGVMHGIFRQWDEAGQLVAQYEMVNGNGTEKIYDSQGTLTTERVMENSVSNGPVMHLTSGDRVLGQTRDGKFVGKNFRFYATGNLANIAWYSNEGIQYGPDISFYKDGRIIPHEWHANGKKVSEIEYKAAVSTDPTLPPYYADTKKYKEFVDEEVKARLEKYQKMPKVKIPLEFDQAGNPIPAR